MSKQDMPNTATVVGRGLIEVGFHLPRFLVNQSDLVFPSNPTPRRMSGVTRVSDHCTLPDPRLGVVLPEQRHTGTD